MNSKSHAFSTAVLTFLSRHLPLKVITKFGLVIPSDTSGIIHLRMSLEHFDKRALRWKRMMALHTLSAHWLADTKTLFGTRSSP